MALAALKRFFVEDSDLPQGWVNEYKHKYTPDVHILEQSKRCFLFEYGEMMEGRREHQDFLDGESQITKIGTAYTRFSNLILYKKDLGPKHSYPIALAHMPKLEKTKRWFLDRHLKEPARIRGDLFMVEGVQSILELDRVRENGYAFKRVRMGILFPYLIRNNGIFEERLEEVSAWVYIGVKTYWDELIDGGYSSSVVRKFKQIDNRREYAEYAMGNYYWYSALEEDNGK